ncbi:hypothetical protein [Microbulbifer sp. VAAF005]|uniref:hypothetical protein n=1 Tax=Microbulbifer sp. VAAF005 TaxID=3034230 RepID=UPI0024AE2608|nr:hypothetical protein [Microbulbifer sp. VAAF005]WHI45023.1 hypothetical protein P0078_14920 [Microbulbifer sp. VAAF005]
MSSKDNTLSIKEELSEVDKLLALVQHITTTNTDCLSKEATGGLYLLVDHVRDRVQGCI